MLRRMLSWLAVAAALLLALLMLAAAALWWGQERLIFLPTPLPPDHRFRLAADVHETWIDVPGARLHALHLRLPNPDGLVFYLHGNAGNLDSWFVNAEFYRALNVDLFMPDYRGYGKSSGRIRSQAELLADVQAAWASVAPAYAGKPVVLAGRSLGSGLAAQLAEHLAAGLAPAQQPTALMLISPYRSMRALAAAHYPLVPAALLRYPLDSEAALQRLASAPQTPQLLLLHGAQDSLIPPSHSDMLAALVPGAVVQHIAGAGHGDLQAVPAYLDAVGAGIRQAMAAAAR